jgi:hypothetical protein
MIRTLSKQVADLSQWTAEQVASRVGKKVVEVVRLQFRVVALTRPGNQYSLPRRTQPSPTGGYAAGCGWRRSPTLQTQGRVS